MKTRASYNSVIIAEYRLLNALAKSKNFRKDIRISEDIFSDQVAKSIYEAIMTLDSKNARITQSALLQAGSNIDFNVTNQVVKAIYDVDEELPENLDDIIDVLKNAQLKDRLLLQLESIKESINEPGNLNAEKILKELYNVDEVLGKSATSDANLLSFKDWADIYIEDLEQRKTGRKYSYGDSLLDEKLFRGAAPGNITIVGASTNMGKSTYVLSLMDNLLEMNQPCLYISLEMGTIDSMDRLIAKRCGIDTPDLYNVEMMDGIIDRVKEEQETLSNRNNFYFCRATGVDINKLRALIKSFKQKSRSDYAMVAIDLLSSMKGFINAGNGTSTAASIEANMIKLEDLAKEQNVHLLGVVQFNRDSDNAKIHAVEEIDMLRPTLSSIKNSNAYAEKATTVLSLFRKKYYADRYCPEDPITETLDDIMEVQVLKDRSTQAGTIFKYIFDGPHFKLLPLLDEDEEKMNQLKQLEADFS